MNAQLNFTCIVSTNVGTLKVINANNFNTKKDPITSTLKYDLKEISKLKKNENQYYFVSKNQLYSLKNLENDDLTLLTNRENNEEICGYDFIGNKIVIGYNDCCKIIENSILKHTLFKSEHKYNSFRYLSDEKVALGGKDIELQIYDINKPSEILFRGKTMGNVNLSLPPKIDISSIEYEFENNQLIYTGDKFGRVQLYDIRAGNRKAIQVALFHSDKSVGLLNTLGSNRILAASNGGKLGIIDFKYIKKGSEIPKNESRIEKFEGGFGMGTITSIYVQKNVKLGYKGNRYRDVALVTSRDRCIRMFDINKRKIMNKMNLPNELCSILVDEVDLIKENAENEDDDEIWEQLKKLDDDDKMI